MGAKVADLLYLPTQMEMQILQKKDYLSSLGVHKMRKVQIVVHQEAEEKAGYKRKGIACFISMSKSVEKHEKL